MATILALDIGTSKICALALRGGKQIALRSAPNDAEMPGLAEDRHEQSPTRILEISLELLHCVCGDTNVHPAEVAGIGLSGQMHGVLLVDKSLRPLTNLITWRDRRGDCEVLGNTHEMRTGCSLHPGYGGATLHHLSRNGQIPSGAIALSMADFVAASLTGVVATEPTHAASWGLFDLQRAAFDLQIVAALKIPVSVLPEIRPSARPLGPLTPGAARALGLPASTQVCSPIGDNQASFIGAAGLAKNRAVLNLGTGGQVSIPCPNYRFTSGLETRPMPFGGFIQVGASLCGGWSYSYLRQFFQMVAKEIGGVCVSDEDAFERMGALATNASSDAGALSVDTHFCGTRGDPMRLGAISGISAINLTPAHLVRGFLEGMAAELGGIIRYSLDTGIDGIVASGNAIWKNPILLEIIKRQTGLPCHLSQCHEEAATGAALAAERGLA